MLTALEEGGVEGASDTAFPAARSPRKPGGWEGRIMIDSDFDAPLPDDLLDAFEGRGED